MSTPESNRAPQPESYETVDWRAVGLRRTAQREVVLELVRDDLAHPTAEWIHQQARLQLPEISLATVYRTLRILKEKGLVHEFSSGNAPARYDASTHDHEHLRCVACGAIQDVDIPQMNEIRRQLAERTGFQVVEHPLVFHGLCRSCAKTESHSPENCS